MVSSACGNPAATPPPAATSPAVSGDIYDHYADVFLKSPEFSLAQEHMIPQLINQRCPEFAPLLEAYYEVTTARWRRAGEIHLVVVDEEGNVLKGVKATMMGVSAPTGLSIEPNVDESAHVFNGPVKIPWRSSSFAVEIQLRKRGYRTARVSFVDVNSRYTGALQGESLRLMERQSQSLDDLRWGFKFPPTTPDGPVRVLLRREVDWDPPVDEDGLLAVHPDKKLIPKTVPPDAPLVASSDGKGIVRADATGTYLVTDKEGKVIYCPRAFKGQTLGFADLGQEYVGGKPIEFVHSSLRRPAFWKAADGPFKLYFYREAKPLPVFEEIERRRDR